MSVAGQEAYSKRFVSLLFKAMLASSRFGEIYQFQFQPIRAFRIHHGPTRPVGSVHETDNNSNVV